MACRKYEPSINNVQHGGQSLATKHGGQSLATSGKGSSSGTDSGGTLSSNSPSDGGAEGNGANNSSPDADNSDGATS